MSTMTSVRNFLIRGRRPVHAITHRVRSTLRSFSQKRAVPLQITLDGYDLLNWRSTDPDVQALVLGARRRGRHQEVPALDAAGPRHGVLRLEELSPGSHLIWARTNRGVRPIALHPAGDGTRNEARHPERGTWHVERGPVPKLVHLAVADEDPGILAFDAALGIVTLEVGLAHSPWSLTLEQRGGGRSLPVEARPGSTSQARVYRLGATQWRDADLPLTGEMTVWDVVLRHDDAPDRRVRLKWRGSGLENPRRALRLRAVFSYAVPGRRIEIRPYWTKDDYLALELKSAPSIGGEPA